MLNLKNFELQISSAIIQRGRQYYEDGAVINFEEIDHNYWQAEVTGNTTYSVEIKLGNKTKIEDHSCNCPYEGDTCKHVVAVLFLLKGELSDAASRSKKVTKPDFKKLLQKGAYQVYHVSYSSNHKYISICPTISAVYYY